MLERIFIFLLPFLYFTPILLHNKRCRKTFLLPLYKKKAAEKANKNRSQYQTKTAVYMVQPETTFSGGLSDRLRGITSIYKECKRQGIPFKIVFEPLHLQDYLEPNKYDWTINDDEICWDTAKVYPGTILTYHHNLKNKLQRFAQQFILRQYLKKNYEQVHIYSNMATAEEEFGELFNDLFKPTPELQEQIDHHLSQLGGDGNYISMTFRFRQLLGDFKEGGETLPIEKRKDYIGRCLKCVEQMHQKYPDKQVLVTSDSKMFLDALPKDSYVYVIPGNVVHIGFTFDAEKKTYMKSFVDYYMLSYASTIYQVRDALLMNSGFPERAAMLNGRNYCEVWMEKIE